jgi:SAM-dependent methyltransferase
MSLSYRIMYRLGVTPWEHAEPAGALVTLVDALPPGAMLDIGCGTGADAVYCADRGWTVTGIDAVGQPLDVARDRAAAAGVTLRLVHGDITDRAVDLGGPYALFLDGGCLHGLPRDQLRAAVARLGAVAVPGARLLMFAFGPGRRGPLPRGIDPADVPGLFPGWDLEFSRPVTDVELRGPARSASPSWHQLVKR